jgi:hypothetical protein
MLFLVCGFLLWLAVSVALLGGGDASFHLGPIGAGLTDAKLLAGHPWSAWLMLTLDLSVVGYGLLRLAQLLRGYEEGELFGQRASAHLSAFALSVVVRELIDMLAPMLGGWSSFSVDSGNLRVLMVGTVFWLLSRILAAAHVVADDHGQII